MLHSIFARTIRDQRRSLPWWIVGLAATAALMMSFYPSVKQSAAQLDEYLKALPEALKATFIGGSTDYASPSGYLNSELFAFFLPIVFITFTVAGGARAIATEEERGTLDLLLSTPMRRRDIVLEKFAALAVSTALLCAAMWASLAVGTELVDFNISLGRLAEAVVSLGLLSLAIGALALAVGAARGSHGLAVGLAATVALLMYLVNSLGLVVQGLRPWRKLSFFYFYAGNDPLNNGISLTHAAVLIASTALLVVVAIVAFDRRDVSA